MRARLRARAFSSRREGLTERLPARPHATTTKKADPHLISVVCGLAKSLFQSQGVSYWGLNNKDKIIAKFSEGQSFVNCGKTLVKSSENLQLARLLARSRAAVVNRKEMASLGFTGMAGARSGLIVPLRLKPGTKGLLLLTHQELEHFSARMVEQAGAFANAIETLLNGFTSELSPELSEQQAQSLVKLAVELKPSLRLTEFAGRFTDRAGEILGARISILALARSERLETIVVHDSTGAADQTASPGVDSALTKLATAHHDTILTGSASALLAPQLAQSLGWKNLCLVRLAGRDGDLLGVLCFVDRAAKLSEADQNLIHALAGHASVALENSRLFSRIEQSKRQWVEDFDAITDLIVVHDPSNRILRVNRSLAVAVGSRPSELVGRKMGDLNPIGMNPSGGACPFCHEPERIGDESVLGAGGRAYLISTSRIAAATEEGSRTIHVLKDITEQRTSQAQLQRERDFNTKILNHTQSMILVLDTAGLISYANRRCYEAGLRREELLGRRLLEFVRRDRGSILEKALEKALQGLASENLELPVLRGNRSSGQYSVSLSPIRDEQGHVNSIVVVMADITDAAVLQAQLRHSEKMAALGQLVSGVAHEINNPLAAIVGYSDLLLENPRVPDAEKEELRIVLKEAERTKDIVQNLLRFARQMPSRRERLDVRAILRQVVQLRTYGCADKGIEVIEHSSSSVPHIVGDAHQLQQVFLNILNNAHDAVGETGHVGRIEIAAAERNGFVEIAIRDNGTGVTDTERIFEPFYTTKELGKGTGLGLSICYGIVREHKGEIFCLNNSDGPGCTFFLRFPVPSAAVAVSNIEAR